MQGTRALQTDDHVAHYRIVSPLGAGGMGEVYLAQDQTLERNVALKILPPDLVRNEERVRRFVREAKSASSLNHPNIVTIYEIGQDEVRGAGATGPGEPGSSSVHYISMELISGETLANRIHHEKTDLRTLLGYLAQAAEGLAKAHAAGIVHRDLKPGNIMVSKDGFTKILDFGLAKLTERAGAEADATSGPTQIEEGTSPGLVIGTVGYMSPEQVQGKAIDSRSDIFSFGCVLYEAVTRRKPFAADSNVETMHKIIHEKPAAVEELNPQAPAEVRRLIRRCLAKNPDQRLQSAKDLALELREIVDEFESLSPSGTSATAAPAGGAVAPRSRTGRWVIAGVIAVGLAGTAIGIWGIRRGGEPGSDSAFERRRLSTLTSRGDVVHASLSPDGRYLAYVCGPQGQRSLRVRQVATGSDVEIVGGPTHDPRAPRFSPDGDYLWYLNRDPDSPLYSSLFQVPSLGGTPVKRRFDVDTAVSFSPDGRRMCFIRGYAANNETKLLIASAEGDSERVVASVGAPRSLMGADPAWSPDGARIAAILTDVSGGRTSRRVVLYREKDGRSEVIEDPAWPIVVECAWLRDGRGLALIGLDLAGVPVQQILLRPYPGERARRVTNDLDGYSSLSLASGEDAIASVRTQITLNLWSVGSREASEPRQLTFATTGDQSVGASVRLTDDGSIIYRGSQGSQNQLFAMPLAGGERRQLTTGKGILTAHEVVPGAIVFQRFVPPELTPRIYRVDLQGGEARRLTSLPSEQLITASRDGGHVLLTRPDRPDEVWTVASSGGEPRLLAPTRGGYSDFSPDGSRILLAGLRTVEGRTTAELVLWSLGVGKALAAIPVLPGMLDAQWSPDGQSITVARTHEGRSELFRWRFDRSKYEPLGAWSHGRILRRWRSPDGDRLAVLCQEGQAQNLWVSDAEGRGATRLTRFDQGRIADAAWSKDGSQIVFAQGQRNSDVVMIQDFR